MSVIEHWDDSKCCCHCPDAKECFRSRHSVSPDDYGEEDDGDCECVCHSEYYAALSDAGLYEDSY